MRHLSWLLLVLCVARANAGSFPITSFEPDSAERARTARDTVGRPVWIGVQCSPVVGDAGQPGQPRTWDAHGAPWIGLRSAWPWTGPSEFWLEGGYEHWNFKAREDVLALGPLLGLLDPFVLDQFTVRTGMDGIVPRGHVVSAAFGVGAGTGWGVGRIGTTEQSGYVPIEILAHALVYVRAGETMRFGVGVSGGQTWLLLHGAIGDPFWHWELLLRVEQFSGRKPRPPAS